MSAGILPVGETVSVLRHSSWTDGGVCGIGLTSTLEYSDFIIGTNVSFESRLGDRGSGTGFLVAGADAIPFVTFPVMIACERGFVDARTLVTFGFLLSDVLDLPGLPLFSFPPRTSAIVLPELAAFFTAASLLRSVTLSLMRTGEGVAGLVADCFFAELTGASPF